MEKIIDLAPIVIFIYNRPWHTSQLLNSLASNPESKESILYVYCDGPKENITEESLQKIMEARQVVKNESRFKDVIIKEQPRNKGLANSIIDGVTEVVNKHGCVIVLEDDLVVSPYFLSYMNDSLQRYENNNKVGQIGACNFFACGKNYPNFFFTSMPDCLGWATWKNKWNHFNPDARQLLEELQAKNLIYKFNTYGAYDMIGMLKQQIEGKVSSWAIRWQAVCVLNNWLTLYPNPSLTNHLQSEEATHANFNILPPMYINSPTFETIEIKEIPLVIKAMKLGYSGVGDYSGKLKKEYKRNFFRKITLDYIYNVIRYKVFRKGR